MLAKKSESVRNSQNVRFFQAILPGGSATTTAAAAAAMAAAEDTQLPEKGIGRRHDKLSRFQPCRTIGIYTKKQIIVLL